MSVRVCDWTKERELRYAGMASSDVFLRSRGGVSWCVVGGVLGLWV